MGKKELLKLTITEASKLIEDKEISPVELTEVCLDRISDTNDELNNFTKVFHDEARRVAKGLEEMQMAGHILGPLHGIPVSVKDNIGIKGYPNHAGSKVLEDFIPEKDSNVVKRLKSAGAVIVGKTNMHELAWGTSTDNPHYGVSRNPWNPERFCSGSSGGSGASVANGTSLASLGTDTGSSVRTPAAINGVVGMRPTLGRVSGEGIIPLSWTLDTCGPLTRDVKDNAIMMNVLAGVEYTDPGTENVRVPDYTRDLEYGAENFTIGIIPDILFKHDQPDVIKSIKTALEHFKTMGARVVEFSSEHLGYDTTAMMTNLVCGVESTAWHYKRTRERSKDYGSDVRVLIEAGEFVPGTGYVNAQRYRRLLMEDFHEAFKTIDFFLMPTIPFTAIPIGDYELIINGVPMQFVDLSLTYTCIASLAGLPAISVPSGLDREGLPIGLQLMGKPFGEPTLYRAAAAFEKIVNIYDKLPAFK